MSASNDIIRRWLPAGLTMVAMAIVIVTGIVVCRALPGIVAQPVVPREMEGATVIVDMADGVTKPQFDATLRCRALTSLPCRLDTLGGRLYVRCAAAVSRERLEQCRAALLRYPTVRTVMLPGIDAEPAGKVTTRQVAAVAAVLLAVLGLSALAARLGGYSPLCAALTGALAGLAAAVAAAVAAPPLPEGALAVTCAVTAALPVLVWVAGERLAGWLTHKSGSDQAASEIR